MSRPQLHFTGPVKSLLLAAATAVLIAVAAGTWYNLTSQPEQNVSVVVDGSNRWCLPNAVTKLQQTAGLRDSSQVGMVFTFSPPQDQAFWNQGVSKALFIVWVKDGRVIGTGELKPYDSTPVSPPSPIDYAIELTPGMWSSSWHSVNIGGSC
jgi:uncharacterized membrane protein (UPF0127 family)